MHWSTYQTFSAAVIFPKPASLAASNRAFTRSPIFSTGTGARTPSPGGHLLDDVFERRGDPAGDGVPPEPESAKCRGLQSAGTLGDGCEPGVAHCVVSDGPPDAPREWTLPVCGDGDVDRAYATVPVRTRGRVVGTRHLRSELASKRACRLVDCAVFRFHVEPGGGTSLPRGLPPRKKGSPPRTAVLDRGSRLNDASQRSWLLIHGRA